MAGVIFFDFTVTWKGSSSEHQPHVNLGPALSAGQLCTAPSFPCWAEAGAAAATQPGPWATSVTLLMEKVQGLRYHVEIIKNPNPCEGGMLAAFSSAAGA